MDKPENYFEGVLQLRNPNEKILNYVDNEIKNKENVWIAKKTITKNGIDLLMSSNKFLKEIGKKLKNRFPGVLKETRTLYSQNHLTSKEVYRGCVMFRFVDIKKGDIITKRGDKLEIISIANDVLVKNLETNKKIHISFEEL